MFQTADFLTWRNSWLTGIEELDAQHAGLAAHVNNIARNLCLEEEQGPASTSEKVDQLDNMVAQLYAMTKQHFQYEEQLMLDAGYPDHPAHVREHSMLLAELKLMMHTHFRTDGEKIDRKTLEALKSWFIGHMTQTDKLFAQFMSRRAANNSRSERP